jgi:hypothetical protein
MEPDEPVSFESNIYLLPNEEELFYRIHETLIKRVRGIVPKCFVLGPRFIIDGKKYDSDTDIYNLFSGLLYNFTIDRSVIPTFFDDMSRIYEIADLNEFIDLIRTIDVDNSIVEYACHVDKVPVDETDLGYFYIRRGFDIDHHRIRVDESLIGDDDFLHVPIYGKVVRTKNARKIVPDSRPIVPIISRRRLYHYDKYVSICIHEHCISFPIF